MTLNRGEGVWEGAGAGTGAGALEQPGVMLCVQGLGGSPSRCSAAARNGALICFTEQQSIGSRGQGKDSCAFEVFLSK